MSYNSGFCLVDVQALAVYFAKTPSQLLGILGKPTEEIGNLNGCEYMHLSNLKIPYFLYSSSVSINVISMGTTELPTPPTLLVPPEMMMGDEAKDPVDDKEASKIEDAVLGSTTVDGLCRST